MATTKRKKPRTAAQKAATERMLAAARARREGGMTKHAKRAKRSKSSHAKGHSMAARVSRLEKGQTVLAGAVQVLAQEVAVHRRALVGGGLLSSRVAKALPKGR